MSESAAEEAIERWLKESGAEKIRESGTGHLVSTCPFHGDRYPSFSIRSDNGLFVCYSQGCGVSGNLVNFLMGALGWSFDKAKEAVEQFGIPSIHDDNIFKLPDYAKRKGHSEEVPEAKMNPGHLGLYMFCPKYMLARGYPKALLKKWGVGYDHGSDRVTIPVFDVAGDLVGISKRSTKDYQQPKYLHLGFKKSKHLYGEYKCPKARHIVVTEGQLDAIAWSALMERAGVEDMPAISTMGSRVSNQQILMMAKHHKVTLALDNDRDGVATTTRIGEELIHRLAPGNLNVVTDLPPGCKDPGDLFEKEFSDKRVLRLIKRVRPYDEVRTSYLFG